MSIAEMRGLISAETGQALRDLAAQVPAHLAIVEIGSFKGKSTAHLATGSKEGHGAPVYAVDPWDLPGNQYGKHGFSDPSVREAFEAQLREQRLWSRVTPIQGFSTLVAAGWSGPTVGLLFVDGDHEEHAVRADVDAWTPLLADSHVIAFDDCDTKRNPGVRIVVDSLDGYEVEVVAGSLAVCRR